LSKGIRIGYRLLQSGGTDMTWNLLFGGAAGQGIDDNIIRGLITAFI
jgi:hypothetical protein